MLTPIYQDSDTIQIGSTYERNLFTGTLDTTNLTPRPTFQKRRDGSDAGAVQMARRQTTETDPATGQPYDPRYNWAIVVAYAVTNTLDLSAQYLLNIGFDDGNGNSIPHTSISLSVAMGEPHA